ncbi:TetR/AcrR family transcriptional regulator [Nocardia sp. NPDC058176]|uniref:TetR/AcrR family transcriptional regulator n=1 Tax=Nocardia sp. NPDC058176 TaxID=3346368 RepID=UPI0036DCE966
MDPAQRVRTRRRGEDLLRAIHAAVLAELADVGYGALTMEGVAARAGTGKAPLYRRWKNKDDMVLDAVRHGFPLRPGPEYSGHLREDLLALLRGLAFGLAGPFGSILRAILSETHRRPALMAALHASIFDPRAAELRTMLRAAAAAGEIRADAVDSTGATLGPELVVFRFLTEGAPVPDATITGIVDDVILPLLS